MAAQCVTTVDNNHDRVIRCTGVLVAPSSSRVRFRMPQACQLMGSLGSSPTDAWVHNANGSCSWPGSCPTIHPPSPQPGHLPIRQLPRRPQGFSHPTRPSALHTVAFRSPVDVDRTQPRPTAASSGSRPSSTARTISPWVSSKDLLEMLLPPLLPMPPITAQNATRGPVAVYRVSSHCVLERLVRTKESRVAVHVRPFDVKTRRPHDLILQAYREVHDRSVRSRG